MPAGGVRACPGRVRTRFVFPLSLQLGCVLRRSPFFRQRRISREIRCDFRAEIADQSCDGSTATIPSSRAAASDRWSLSSPWLRW